MCNCKPSSCIHKPYRVVTVHETSQATGNIIAKYYVVNNRTREVQSIWVQLIEARQVEARLNSYAKKEII